MLEAIREDTKRKRLGAGDGVIARLAIGKHAREIRNLRDPAAVLFAIDFKRKMHGSFGGNVMPGM